MAGDPVVDVDGTLGQVLRVEGPRALVSWGDGAAETWADVAPLRLAGSGPAVDQARWAGWRIERAVNAVVAIGAENDRTKALAHAQSALEELFAAKVATARAVYELCGLDAPEADLQ